MYDKGIAKALPMSSHYSWFNMRRVTLYVNDKILPMFEKPFLRCQPKQSGTNDKLLRRYAKIYDRAIAKAHPVSAHHSWFGMPRVTLLVNNRSSLCLKNHFYVANQNHL